MTPEQSRKLDELYAWMQARKVQQLSYPVDDASKRALEVVLGQGLGNTAKTQVYTDSHGDTLTGPKAYVKTLVVSAGGILYELPSIL